MCRWLAYYCKPVRMDKVLFGPQHSLIEQSLHSRLGAETTTATASVSAGTGRTAPPVLQEHGACVERPEPARPRQAVESHLFIAHVRATSGTPVQQSNCHPFRYGKWLWAHNGVVHDSPR